MKKEKADTVQVSVKVRATSEGYYGERIVNVGEEFVYKGGLNRKGGLPLWVQPLEEWPKKKKVEKVEKVETPAPEKKSMLGSLKSMI